MVALETPGRDVSIDASLGVYALPGGKDTALELLPKGSNA